MNRIIFFVFTVFFSFTGFSQSLLPPMDIPLLMSGNFGELRTNHFHAGLDFKTEGRTGIPVKAVKEGYIARIFVSPRGYGRALYIIHPDGTKTVYGHLESFKREVEEYVKDYQYKEETFFADLYPDPALFPVLAGEVIALSGNTGGSGGPHLHFEIRDAVTDEVYDPLPYYKDKIRDNRPPEISGIMIFPQTGKGVVNGTAVNQEIKITKDKAGNQVLSPVIRAWGDIGIGVKAYDRMTNTSNTYLPKYIKLEIDGLEIFSQEMDHFSFDESRYLNSLISFDDWTYKKSFYMKSFIEPGNHLKIYKGKYTGIYSIEEEKEYTCRYTLTDEYGNKSVLNFVIQGQKQEIPVYNRLGEWFPWNRDNELSNELVSLKIPRGNLYTDVDFVFDETALYTDYSSLFQLGKRIPLHSYCPLKIKIMNDSYPDKSKYGVIMVNGQRTSWQGGSYEDGYIHTEIRELGNYSVTVDTIPPKISPQNPEGWTSAGMITFKVTDDLSGVKEYKGTLDGKFVLFEYDPKTARIFCKFDKNRMNKGKQKLEFVVKDSCGNTSTYTRDVVL